MECIRNDFCFPHLYTMNLVSSLQTRPVTNIWKIESILYLKYIINTNVFVVENTELQ